MFSTFMYLGTEIRNVDIAEIDLIGISVHLLLSVAVELPEGIEVIPFGNLCDQFSRKRVEVQGSMGGGFDNSTADLWLHLRTTFSHSVSVLHGKKANSP